MRLSQVADMLKLEFCHLIDDDPSISVRVRLIMKYSATNVCTFDRIYSVGEFKTNYTRNTWEELRAVTGVAISWRRRVTRLGG